MARAILFLLFFFFQILAKILKILLILGQFIFIFILPFLDGINKIPTYVNEFNVNLVRICLRFEKRKGKLFDINFNYFFGMKRKKFGGSRGWREKFVVPP